MLVNNEIKDKQEQVFEDFCTTNDIKMSYGQFEEWVEKYYEEDFMVKQRKELEQLDNDMSVKQRIQSLSFIEDIPEDLTADKYLVMYKKIWSIVRHDLWKEIQAKKKVLRVQDLPIDEFNTLYNETHKRFEQIRQEVYALIMGDEQITPELAREYMQKAYVSYATISSTAKNENEKVEVSRWPSLVQ